MSLVYNMPDGAGLLTSHGQMQMLARPALDVTIAHSVHLPNTALWYSMDELFAVPVDCAL